MDGFAVAFRASSAFPGMEVAVHFCLETLYHLPELLAVHGILVNFLVVG